jgi:hypothetical protein
MPAYNRRIEALAEAVARTTGYASPASSLYKARNPGAIKATLPEQPRTPEGYRVYASFLDGWQSLLHDLAKKVSGSSNSKLKPESTLNDLALVRNEPLTVARTWSLFLRAALENDSLRPATPLSYFSEN